MVVDDDIDPADMDKVIGAMCTRCDPREGMEILRGCWSSALDPMAYGEKDPRNARVVIDACKPFGQSPRYVPDRGAVEQRGRGSGAQQIRRQAAKVTDAMTDKVDLKLRINGCDHAVRVEPRKTLVDAIREDCGLTGTHIGCEHGVCGACTVIVGNEAVRSCLMFAVQAQGKPIRTVEGLAKGNALHPLQRAFIAHHGLQCGFCTPGFLMLAANMLERNPHIGDEA